MCTYCFLVWKNKRLKEDSFWNFLFTIGYNLSDHETSIIIILSLRAKYFFSFGCKWGLKYLNGIWTSFPVDSSQSRSWKNTWDVFNSGNDLDRKPIWEACDLLRTVTLGSTLTLNFSQQLIHRKLYHLLKIYLFVQFFCFLFFVFKWRWETCKACHEVHLQGPQRESAVSVHSPGNVLQVPKGNL